MAVGGAAHDEESIGGLFGRLIDDARSLLRAEVNLHWQTYRSELRQIRGAVILVVLGAVLAQVSLVALMVGCVIGLSPWLGPVAAGVVVTLLTLAVAGVLLWLAARRFTAAAAGRADKAAGKPR